MFSHGLSQLRKSLGGHEHLPGVVTSTLLFWIDAVCITEVLASRLIANNLEK
jgi:hypothetical protein